MIEQIGSRNYLFKDTEIAEWALHLQVILGNVHNFIIDTGVGIRSIQPILDFLKNDMKPIIVINTHFHWDHVIGNYLFNHHTIVSHTQCYNILNNQWDEIVNERLKYIQAKCDKKLPNLLFSESLTYLEDQIELFYTPGHTIDGISVLDCVDGILNVGDNLGDTLEQIVPDIECMEAYLESILRYQQIEGLNKIVSAHCGVAPVEVIRDILNILTKNN